MAITSADVAFAVSQFRFGESAVAEKQFSAIFGAYKFFGDMF